MILFGMILACVASFTTGVLAADPGMWAPENDSPLD